MNKVKAILIKTAAILEVVLTAIFSLAAPLLLFSVFWMFRTWNQLTMDELVFHLTGPLEGTNSDMVREYLIQCALPALLVFAVILVVLFLLRKKRFFYLITGVLLLVWILVCLGALYVTANRLELEDYVDSQGSYSGFIDSNYVDPAETSVTFPEQKRNLIYIFLESMETTYADGASGGAFEENVIPELTKIAEENEDFSGFGASINGAHAMKGTTWTMGAMFAHTSGLPLNIPIGQNDMGTQDSFFAGATTLGDILSEEGYSQTLLLGSDATFGGRRLYFTEHGDYDMVDYEYARKNGMIPEDYSVWWGYEDEKLFQFAKEKLLELSSQDNPFNLTMLTVDTHFEDGYLCEKCPDTFGDNQYANVMACSSQQVAEFISWIQEQDFYENTTIVLAGDHLTMDSDFCENVSGDYDRKTYVAYINAAQQTQKSEARDYTTFDLFPTTLAALGADIEGDRLGLGTNLFSMEETLTETYGEDYMNGELKKKSRMLNRLADIDEDVPELQGNDEAEETPQATVSVGIYESQTATIPIIVSDIQNVENDIGSIVVCAWTKEDQSDAQWSQLTENEDGTYGIHLNTLPFADRSAVVRMQIFLLDDEGTSYFIGEKAALMQDGQQGMTANRS
ncbi:sulfatase-like hydrolase/transferase [uncultured Merdimonas sp.]|uniref:sulfatase-like hydrolase/transferase n=1 Tax=uncultured Merdimonas sp. TaxID=2023269 RepID=UPI00320B8EDF